jgi:hypothetical protein
MKDKPKMFAAIFLIFLFLIISVRIYQSKKREAEMDEIMKRYQHSQQDSVPH